MAEVDNEDLHFGSDNYISMIKSSDEQTKGNTTQSASEQCNAYQHAPEWFEDSNICTVTCDKHPDQKLLFFCKEHNAVVCGKCLHAEHKPCELRDISIARKQCNKPDYQSIIERATEVRNEIKHAEVAASKCGNKAVKQNLEAIGCIKHARKSLNELFDKAEKDLLESVEAVKCSNDTELQSINENLQDADSKLASIQERLSDKTACLNDLFAESNKSSVTIEAVVNNISGIKAIQLQCIEFWPHSHKDVESTHGSLLGELEPMPISLQMPGKSIRKLKGKRIQQICTTKSKDAVQPEHISGIVNVSKGIVACVDRSNGSASLIDVMQGKFISAISLTDNPWDIARTSQDSVAVTLPALEKIQFLKVDSNVLSVMQPLINVRGNCRGIDCFDEKLVVAYEKQSKIEVIDFHGNVVKCIQYDWLRSPSYVAVSYDSHYIIASDTQEGCLYKVTLDGHLEHMLKCEALKNPEGICVCRDGSLLVGDDDALYVAEEFMSVQVLHVHQNGKLDRVSALCYEEDSKILCLCQPTSTSVFVFKFK